MNHPMQTLFNPVLFASSGLMLLLSMPVHAAMMPGAKPKEWPANPQKHVVSINRVAKDDAGKKAIGIAENLMPAKDDVLAAARMKNPDATCVDRQWWHEESLGIKIPYAITSEAITYYSDLVTGFGKQALQRYVEPNSSLSYEATVQQSEAFEIDGKAFKNVTVVKLSLRFSENFTTTQTEGMSFEKQRTVVLDQDGKVLHVSGDGPAKAMILAI